jgi:hypothetical protein
MRKRDDEIYQLAKNQALVKRLKNKRFRPFCLCLPGVMFITRGSKNSLFKIMIFSNLRHGDWWLRDNFSNQITDADKACRSSEISVDLIIISLFVDL